MQKRNKETSNNYHEPVMKKQLIMAQKHNKKIEKCDTPCLSLPLPHTLTQINHSPSFLSPIVCSNNTLIMISLSEMRQSNGFRNVSNVKIFNLHLQNTNLIHWFHLPKQSNKKQRFLKKYQTPNELYHTALAYIYGTQG